MLVNKTFDLSHFFLAISAGSSLWEPVDSFAAKRKKNKKLLWIHQEITLPGVNTQAEECQLDALVTLAESVLTVPHCSAEAGDSRVAPQRQMRNTFTAYKDIYDLLVCMQKCDVGQDGKSEYSCGKFFKKLKTANLFF